MQNKKVHRRKHLVLYIPENINLDELLKQNPPEFKYYKDCFTYILYLIVSIPSRLKDFDIEGNDGFIPINKKILQKRIWDYRPYIDYLVKHGVVEESKHYIPGEKSGGLRYAPEYETKIKSVKITKWTLIKSIISLTKETDKEAEQKLDYLKKWFNDKIRIDMDGVLDYLYSEYEKDKLNPEIKHANARFNVRYMTAFKIKNRQFNFTVDNTSGRLHTPLTQLKKELRKHITYDGKKLCNVDITNSQPFLATSFLHPELYKQNKIEDRLIHYNDNYISTHTELPIFNSGYNPTMVVKLIEEKKDEDDVQLFLKLVRSGDFYEEFGQILVQNGTVPNADLKTLRKEAKKRTFGALFSPNTSISYKHEVKDFRNNFPNVYEIMTKIKKGKGKHPALACMLQNLEAELILWKCCGTISKEKPDLPIFTIHDSIVTTVENAVYVKAVMEREFKDSLSFKPDIKIEVWE